MTTRNLVWWGVFLIVSIWLQMFFPGLDLLLPGLLLAMHEGKRTQTAWVFILFVLVQEGLGSLDFGACALWYLSVMFLFVATHWIFQTESLLFMLLISLASGGIHYLVILLMTSLQQMSIDMDLLLHESVYQVAASFIVWKAAILSRRLVISHAHSA